MQLYNDNRKYQEYVDITLRDGRELKLANEQLWNGGLSIEDAVSGDNSFDIGAAIINKCTVTINNIYDEFSEYDFTDAKVVAYIGLILPDQTIEKIRKGTYTVDDAKYNGSIIVLSCLDNMSKFDKKYSQSQLRYPATLNQIVRDACSVCGVSLQTYNFPHDSFIVQTRPNDEAVTFREIVSWCAQIACCFCRCDALGRLELKWYDQESLEKVGLDGGIFDSLNPDRYTTGDSADGGTFSPWNTGYVEDGGEFGDRNNIHIIYSLYSMNISVDDVVITGVRIVEKNKEDTEEVITTYQSGSDGYVISIENNELIKGGAGKTIVGWVGEQLIGFRFRKADFSHSSDPTIEAGDVGFLIDRKQNVYHIPITFTKFGTGGSQSTKSSAQTPARNSAERFSAETKNYVDYRKDIEKERTDREKALDDLKNRIDNSPGLFTTTVNQSNGSSIFYMHNKPKLEESDIVWKMTAEAWGVSTDGGKSYNAGMTVDGDTIVRILTAVGINADWIKTGALKIQKGNKVMVNMDFITKRVELYPDVFALASGETIDSIAQGKADDALGDAKDYADTAASAAVKAQTQADIFNKLTNNGNIKGIYMQKGQLYISFTYAKGGELVLGGANNTYGVFKLLDAKGNILTLLDRTGGYIQSEDFQMSDYSVGTTGTVTGKVLSGCKVDVQNGAFYTPQIIIMDNHIDVNGYETLGYRKSGSVIGDYSFAQGINVSASGRSSHAQGTLTDASGVESHAEGNRATASGAHSHAEGYDTIASGQQSHAEGYGSTASGTASHAEGYRTAALSSYHHACGMNNSGSYLFVVGNGFSSSSPNDAFYVTNDGNIAASGTKSRIVDTENFGKILQYCYETSSPMFGDIGEGTTDETGVCYIYLDDIFSETVSSDMEYQVFLQKEGQGDLWVDSKQSACFVVKGTPNLKFAWEIKIKQKDYEYLRLENESVNSETRDEVFYESVTEISVMDGQNEVDYEMELDNIMSGEYEKSIQSVEEFENTISEYYGIQEMESERAIAENEFY